MFSDSNYKETFTRKQPAKNKVVVSDTPAYFLYATDYKDGKGAKHFTVSTFPRFLEDYLQSPPKDRNHYEIVLDEYPCKLFFDCEFDPILNPHTRMETVVKILHKTLEKVFNHPIPSPLRLNANGPKKQSCHLIYPDIVFESRHQSNHCVCTLMVPHFQNDTSMIVTAPNGKETLAVDLSVYDKDRNFRMYGSCKAGSTRTLLRPGEKTMDEDTLIDSLITVIKPGVKPIKFDGANVVKKWRRGKKRKRGAAADSDDKIKEKIEKDLQSYGFFDPRFNTLYDNGIRGDYKVYEIVPGIPCPRAKRRHQKNNTYFMFDPDSKRGFFQCADPTCRASNGKSYRWEDQIWD